MQTLIYLKLSVAGHLTIFLTRTRGPFWSIRPANILLLAVVGTQALATLIAVYGIFMTPLGWGWAGFVWAWAIAWALLNDRVKLAAYWILDRTGKAGAAKRELGAKGHAKPDAKPDAKTGAAPTAEPDAKPDAKPDAEAVAAPAAEPGPKPEAGTPATPQLVKRVHEMYEELGRGDVKAVQESDMKEKAKERNPR